MSPETYVDHSQAAPSGRDEESPHWANGSHGSRGTGPRKKKSHAGISLVAAVALLVVLLAAGIIPQLRRKQALAEQTREGSGGVSVVNVVTPIHVTTPDDLMLPGNIEPVEVSPINARTTGYVRHWYADIGTKVKMGQVLAEIESPEVDEQLAQARADAAKSDAAVAQSRAALGTAEAGVEQAKADAARLQAAMAQAKADSMKAQATVDQSQAEQSRAQAGVSQGKAEVARSGATVGQARAALVRMQANLLAARQDLASRKANLEHTKAAEGIAKTTALRWASLVKDGAVAGQDADEKEAAYEGSVADRVAAEAAVSSAAANVDAVAASVKASESDIEAAQAGVGSSEASEDAAVQGVRSSGSNIDAMKAGFTSSQANIEAAASAWKSSLANIRAAEKKVSAAHADVTAAQAAARSAEANVQRYVVMQSFEKITAPFDGVVTARNVDTGNLVTVGSAAMASPGSGSSDSPSTAAMKSGLFAVARSDVLRIQVEVPQTFLRSVAAGDKALVEVREYPHREFEGKIALLAKAMDASSRTMLVEVHLVNTDNLLVPGMFAQVKMTPSGAFRPLRIPAATLITSADGTQVAEVTPQHTIHMVAVKLGQDFGTEIEVVSGLKGNEELVSNPGDTTAEGQPVKVEATEGPATTAAPPPTVGKPTKS